MRFFSTAKKILLTSMYLYACFSCTVYADENADENAAVAEQPIEATPQQAVTEVAPDTQVDTSEPDTQVETQAETQADTSKAEATPQPPLIAPEPTQSYEPKAPDDTPDNTTAADTTIKEGTNKESSSDDSQRTIGNTPQPPLIDPQEKPSYGPKEVDDTSQKDAIIPIDKPAETTQEVGTKTETKTEKSTEAEELAEPVEPVLVEEEFPESTATEQETIITEKAEEAEVKKEQKEKAKKWTETYPVSVNADWLQLKSGEWLRGRITIMQKDSLEFDSDELDDLVIEWKNVKYIKSYEPYSLRFDSQGRTSIIGIIEVVGDKVHVKTDYDDQTFERSDLQTIASGRETEISFWKNKVTFGINVRKGNTDQTDFTSKISAKRRTTGSRLVLDYLGNFTKVQDTETINNHRVNETYDVFLSRDLFWTPIFSEFYRDPFQNIERRLYAGIGVGYSIINTNETEWDVSAGPAYQQTKFVSVLPGVDQEDSTLTMALGTNFETELNSKVDLEGLYSITLGDEETGNYSHHSLITVETELTDKLDFDVTAVWDHVKSPVTGEDNITPDSNDFRIMIGLGYDL